MNEIKTKLFYTELFDGLPKGFRQVVCDTECIKAVIVPRAQTSEISAYINKDTMAVYLLIGESETGEIKIYVGQTKRTQLRAKEHYKKRDWWSEVIYFINRLDKGFTSVELDYLEWLLIQKLAQAKRVTLDNGNNASANEPLIPSEKKSSFINYYNQIVALTDVMRLDIFNKVYAQNNSEISFFCKNSKGADGTAFYREDGIYVQPGSKCVVELTASGKKSSYIQPARKRLLEEKVLTFNNGELVFAQEYKFKTPSGASDIILGTPSNGWLHWKDSSDKTMDDHFRKITN